MLAELVPLPPRPSFPRRARFGYVGSLTRTIEHGVRNSRRACPRALLHRHHPGRSVDVTFA